MLNYKFVAEQLNDGSIVRRPKIKVCLRGSKSSMNFLALLDSGTDITILPKAIADFLGLDYDETEKTEFFGFGKEAFEAVQSTVDIMFLSSALRETSNLRNIPVLIPLAGEEKEPVLGCKGVFSTLKITFVNGKKIQITSTKQN